MTDKDLLLAGKTVRARYNVSARTLSRWVGQKHLDFPQPVTLNGRNYWRRADLERWEAAWPKTQAL